MAERREPIRLVLEGDCAAEARTAAEVFRTLDEQQGES